MYYCATFHKLMRHQNIAPISPAHFADDVHSSEVMEMEEDHGEKSAPEEAKAFCNLICGP
jgi:hypothetical protein